MQVQRLCYASAADEEDKKGGLDKKIVRVTLGREAERYRVQTSHVRWWGAGVWPTALAVER